MTKPLSFLKLILSFVQRSLKNSNKVNNGDKKLALVFCSSFLLFCPLVFETYLPDMKLVSKWQEQVDVCPWSKGSRICFYLKVQNQSSILFEVRGKFRGVAKLWVSVSLGRRGTQCDAGMLPALFPGRIKLFSPY